MLTQATSHSFSSSSSFSSYRAESPTLLILILVGPPKSGKTTFANNLLKNQPELWSRISLDFNSCWHFDLLSDSPDGRHIIVDRCNLKLPHRLTWLHLSEFSSRFIYRIALRFSKHSYPDVHFYDSENLSEILCIDGDQNGHDFALRRLCFLAHSFCPNFPPPPTGDLNSAYLSSDNLVPLLDSFIGEWYTTRVDKGSSTTSWPLQLRRNPSRGKPSWSVTIESPFRFSSLQLTIQETAHGFLCYCGNGILNISRSQQHSLLWVTEKGEVSCWTRFQPHCIPTYAQCSFIASSVNPLRAALKAPPLRMGDIVLNSLSVQDDSDRLTDSQILAESEHQIVAVNSCYHWPQVAVSTPMSSLRSGVSAQLSSSAGDSISVDADRRPVSIEGASRSSGEAAIAED